MFIQSSLRIGLALIGLLAAHNAMAAESFWRDVPPDEIVARGEPWVTPESGRTVELDVANLRTLLKSAPLESDVLASESDVVLSVPMADGGFTRFTLVASTVMEPGLAAKFPEIQTFAGQGIDDPTATLRLDINPRGFHAQVLSAKGESYIDPWQRNDDRHYVVYTRGDFGDQRKRYSCGTQETAVEKFGGLQDLRMRKMPKNPAGSILRTYRIAIASTSTYTNAFGGTVADGIAGLTTMVNRLNGVYEREIATRLVLVANNDLIVYTNANVGPLGPSANSPSVLLQTTIDNAIGFANYDIGHAVGGSGGGGAITPLGNVCGTSKARGFTSLSPPRGDIFDIDFVAHELGHQLGGSHTWNGCGGGGQWSAASAQEPGSGTTIMAYAGICNDNLLPNSDAYFHARSFTQIWQILNNGGPGNGNTVCGTTTPTGNQVPTVVAPANMTIPKRTPFQLTAVGSDPNPRDILSYNWEQVDTGATGQPSSTGDNGTAPLFRSFNSSTSPTRVFPSLRFILDNANQPPLTTPLPPAGGSFFTGEILPNPASGSRVMNFRVTVRDNRAGGGGLVHSPNVEVTAVADAGPFTVGNVSGTQTGGTSFGVTWTVANTDQAPISTSQVNILLSRDGGYTFQPLVSGTPNDGAETVLLPNVATTRARIRVEAANGAGIAPGNTFFDVTDSNFGISGAGTGITVTTLTDATNIIATQQGSPAPALRNIATIAGGVPPYSVSALPFPPNSDLQVQSVQVSGNTVSATALASCLIAAPNLPSFRTYPAVLFVVDSGGREGSAEFPINVSNNSIPTLGTYTDRALAPGGSTTVTPSAAPIDANGNLVSQSVTPTTLPGGGTISIASNGVVSIATNASTTPGSYTVTASVTDSCGARTSKTLQLCVLGSSACTGTDLIFANGFQ